MVCIRCKMVVKEELMKLGLHYSEVELGEVEIVGSISAAHQGGPLEIGSRIDG
jgi:hypothetical protein